MKEKNKILEKIQVQVEDLESIMLEVSGIGSLSSENLEFIQEHYLVAFSALEDAKQAILNDDLEYYLTPYTVACSCSGVIFGMCYQAKGLSKLKSSYSKLRYETDPIQLALKEIEQSYKTKKNKFKIYGFSAQFIREMADKYPVITSQKTIERLVTKLNKENDEIPR